MADPFWDHIDEQLKKVMAATTVDEVLAACPPVMFDGSPNPGSDGFFEGSGGDTSMLDALDAAPGWVIETFKAEYYFCMRDPQGDLLSYVEGDLYRGNRLAASVLP